MNSDESPAPQIRDHHHALSFGQAADLYDAARPSYPDEALHWAFGDTALDIVELGAGTGLLTRGLIALGHRVTAVEPDPQMLRKLVDTTTGLQGHQVGTAEEVSLPSGAADTVVAGQAYHWFDPPRALPNIKRLLRDGGFFCPIWNVRDESVDWVKQLTGIVGISAAEELAGRMSVDDKPFAPYFATSELRIFTHAKPLDRGGLVRLVKSRSPYITADEKRKEEILAGVDELMDTHPQLAGRETFDMPYRTHVFKARAH